MAKTKAQKQAAVEALVSQMQGAKAAVFANFQGLTVSELEGLRGKCREQSVTCVATKKTLLRHALKEMGHEVDTKAFEGGVAAFFGLEDEVAAAKVVADYAKDHEVVNIFGGVLEGNYIESEKVKQLSAVPSKQELLAKLVGSINAPVSGFVNVLAGNMRGLVTVLGAIKDKKA